KDGLADVLLIVRLLRHLDTGAAGDVVQPHLAGPNRPRAAEVLVRGDELPVRRPGRAVEQPEVFFGDLGRLRAVAIHDPDVVAAAPIARESDMFAVGAVAWLHIP